MVFLQYNGNLHDLPHLAVRKLQITPPRFLTYYKPIIYDIHKNTASESLSGASVVCSAPVGVRKAELT